MTVQPELPRKVSQIRHDLDDLYELVSRVDQGQAATAGVLRRHGNRLEELQQTLDLHGGRLDRIEDNQSRVQGDLHQLQGDLHQLQGDLHQLQGDLHQLHNHQRQQFEHLSAQMAEILGVFSGRPATTDPAPEPEP